MNNFQDVNGFSDVEHSPSSNTVSRKYRSQEQDMGKDQFNTIKGKERTLLFN